MDRNNEKESLYQLQQHVYFVTEKGVSDGEIAAIYQLGSGEYLYNVQVWLEGYMPIFLGNNFVQEKMVFENEEKAHEAWGIILFSKVMTDRLNEKQ